MNPVSSSTTQKQNASVSNGNVQSSRSKRRLISEYVRTILTWYVFYVKGITNYELGSPKQSAKHTALKF
jgi:hypothetical protein